MTRAAQIAPGQLLQTRGGARVRPPIPFACNGMVQLWTGSGNSQDVFLTLRLWGLTSLQHQ